MATGLLLTQIGHEADRPLRIVFRSDSRSRLGDGATCVLRPANDGTEIEVPWRYWGERWGEFWWIADLDAPPAGTCHVSTTDVSGLVWEDELTVEPNALFKATVGSVAIGQFERRMLIPTVREKGWIDCGAHLSEANSHAVAVIGMCHLYNLRRDELTPNDQKALVRQIRVGVDYFHFVADQARERGLPDGTFQHEPVNQTTWLLEDSLQIGIALCLAAAVLSREGSEGTRILQRALTAFRHLATHPEPELKGFSRFAHALDTETESPREWMTREYLLYLEFTLRLLAATGEPTTAATENDRELIMSEIEHCVRAVSERWVDPGPDAELPPHFIPFPGVTQPEVAWCHHDVGRDTGGVFPHYVLPLEMFAETFPDHELAPRARTMVDRFADGYLRRAYAGSPFGLLPNTWKAGEGWLYFAGTWHGMNSSYLLMAMQLFALYSRRGQEWMRRMGWAQLDWVAGLNCGLTNESQWACVMSSYDVAPETARPVSMVYGIGREFAGSWRTIRGSVCNGFSRGAQFHFDVEPRVAEDRPEAFTDEDWITHAGAWLAALAHAPRE